MKRINFDAQSATAVLPEVMAAMLPYFSELHGNATAPHQEGLWAREALDTARAQVAGLIHAQSPEDIIFTASGMEAVNLAIKGTAWANQRRGNHIVATAIEHPAVLQSIEFLRPLGWECTKVPVDAQGLADPGAIRVAITDKTVLICVHHANHEVGAIEPIREIGAIAMEKGIPLFVDASATVGWLPVDVQQMGASLLSFSAHRFYGPKGAGVLYRHRQARLVSLIHGGIQEGGRRAGTENVPAIVGAGLAAEIAGREQGPRLAHISALQARLWAGLAKAVPRLHWNGPAPGERRLGTNLNFSVSGVEGEALLLRCDMKGLAFASGSSCLGRSLRVSPVLAAIGLDHGLARGCVLMTLGKDNTGEEVDEALRIFPAAVATLREMSPAGT